MNTKFFFSTMLFFSTRECDDDDDGIVLQRFFDDVVVFLIYNEYGGMPPVGIFLVWIGMELFFDDVVVLWKNMASLIFATDDNFLFFDERKKKGKTGNRTRVIAATTQCSATKLSSHLPTCALANRNTETQKHRYVRNFS